MNKKQIISILRKNGVKANYKNLCSTSDCRSIGRDYVVTGYCKKDNEIVAYHIYEDKRVVFINHA